MRRPTRTLSLAVGLMGLVIAWLVRDLSVSRVLDEAPRLLGTGVEEAQGSSHRALPFSFIENRGQWDDASRFAVRARDLVAALEPGAVSVGCGDVEGNGHVVRFVFDESRTAEPVAEGQRPGLHHFLIGNDRSRWRRDVRGFASVLYRDVRPGVDVRIREDRLRVGGLEYDVHAAGGSDPKALVIRCEGADSLWVDERGQLVVETAAGPMHHRRPLAWAELTDGRRLAVACSYRLLGEDQFAFEIEGRPDGLPLVIDPGIEWSTYFGGSVGENLQAVDVAPSGNVTIAGTTGSLDLPTSPGAFDPTFDTGGFARLDGFVSQFDPTGSTLVFSTYIGGSEVDRIQAVAVGQSGRVYVGGWTAASDFPVTTGAFDRRLDGAVDAVLAGLSADGRELLAGTYLGGDWLDLEEVNDLVIAANGDVVAVCEAPIGFPTTPGAYDTTPNGGDDVGLVRMDPDLSTLIFSTLLGGSNSDGGRGLALTAEEDVVIAGGTLSPDFPSTPGALSDAFPEGFVVVVSSDGSRLLHSTALGGPASSNDSPRDVAVGPLGNIFVTGQAVAPNFPTTPGSFDPSSPVTFSPEGFVSCLDPTLSTLIYSTYLGGGPIDELFSIVVDSSGSAMVAGYTQSITYPVTPGAFSTVNQGVDLMVTRLNADGSDLLYSTFLGSTRGDGGSSSPTRLALTQDGSLIVAGPTDGADYPVTPGAFQELAPSSDPMVVTRLDLLPTGAARVGIPSRGCNGLPVAGITAMPVGGDTVSLTCLNAPAFASHGLLAVASAPLAAPLRVVGIDLWVDPASLLSLQPVHANGVGLGEFEVRVPQSPGAKAWLQFLWRDDCAPGGWSASSGLAIEIQ